MAIIRIDCASCQGTGLYVGCCERGGLAVVCDTCNGTGCEELKYEPFEGRKAVPEGVTRIAANTYGHVCNASDYDPGSISVEEWQDGKPISLIPSEWMQTCICPVQHARINGTGYQCKAISDILGRRFDDCKHFQYKAECWKAYKEWLANKEKK